MEFRPDWIYAYTLEGHAKAITCLENIENNRFASGSDDTTIKIWDAKKFVCLKTLTGHQDAVWCLKSSNSDRLASGSFKVILVKTLPCQIPKCLYLSKNLIFSGKSF